MHSGMSLADRIDNWARAMQTGLARGRARSLEGLWRSPQPWDEPVYTYRGGVDMQDAYAVEMAWASLPEFPRYILRAQYCLRWPMPQTCRVVSRLTHIPCRPREYDKHLADSIEGLELALQRSAVENRNLLRRFAKKVLALADGKFYKWTTT